MLGTTFSMVKVGMAPVLSSVSLVEVLMGRERERYKPKSVVKLQEGERLDELL